MTPAGHVAGVPLRVGDKMETDRAKIITWRASLRTTASGCLRRRSTLLGMPLWPRARLSLLRESIRMRGAKTLDADARSASPTHATKCWMASGRMSSSSSTAVFSAAVIQPARLLSATWCQYLSDSSRRYDHSPSCSAVCVHHAEDLVGSQDGDTC